MRRSCRAHGHKIKTSVKLKPRRDRLITLPAQTYRDSCNLLHLRGVSSSELLSSSELVCGFAGTGVALAGTAFALCGTLTVGISSSEPKTNGTKTQK
jgi:hypothetical protein